jgi:hypothetical protein
VKLFWIILGVFSIIAAAIAWAQIGEQGRAESFVDARIAPERGPEPVGGIPPLAKSPADRIESGEVEDEPAVTNDRAPFDSERQLVEDLLSPRLGEAAEPGTEPWSQPSHGTSGEHSPEAPLAAENPWAQREGKLAHSVEPQADGSVLLDDTFTIRGEGTAESPYEISWDLLLSAAETYQPRLGMAELPQRVQMLNGRHVRISGYLMFPTAAFEAREVLVMLNMWDGCCIGMMPSPYDAIEVELREPVSGSRRQFFNYGTIEGVLQVDPYLINDWLIGLYVMEGATLKVGM